MIRLAEGEMKRASEAKYLLLSQMDEGFVVTDAVTGRLLSVDEVNNAPDPQPNAEPVITEVPYRYRAPMELDTKLYCPCGGISLSKGDFSHVIWETREAHLGA